MISTLQNFRLYAEDMQRSLSRVNAQQAVERDAAYYAANIGTVDSVDDFMADRRLYTYALKAHGLSELSNSQAMVRKILESDLADQASFVNRLSDTRYRTFAAAFDFTAAAAKPSLQTQAQTDRVVEAYSEHRIRAASIAAETVGEYQRRVAAIRNVDQFLADDVLFEVTAKVVGLDPQILSRDYLRAALVDGLNDDPATTGDNALVWLSQQFNFDADGKVPAGQSAQAAASVAQTVKRFNDAAGTASSPQAAAQRVAYISDAMATVTSADALVGDPILFDVMMTAFGLKAATETPAAIRNVLASDPNGEPLSSMPAGTPAEIARKEKLVALNAAFGFDTLGNAPAGAAIAPADLERLVDGYYANYDPADTSGDDALATNSFRVRLAAMDSLDDLLRKDQVFGRPVLDYVLKAFDLDPKATSINMVRRVLTSDPSDPKSYVAKLDDPRWTDFAAAFNFDAAGKLRAERSVQSARNQEAIALRYASSFGENQSEASKAAARKDTETYLTTVGSIATLEEFLANDTVVDFALQAFGLSEEKPKIADLRRILTSDLADPDSFANLADNPAYRDLAASFNFLPDGRIGLSGDAVQRPADIYSTQNLYLLQTLEEQAGEQSEGTRLALYFLRKAPDIKSPLSILADKALFEVVRTALGLPVSMSQQDIDRQAATIEARLDIADFSDPTKLDRFISRFATLYDLANGTASTNAPILALFGGGGSGTVAAGIAGLF